MWEEYELTLHAAMKLRSPEYNDAPAMKRNANSLREEIKKLGDVNVGAIEEYKEISERYTFMNGQREDLIKAEANLVSVIEELDTGMRKQFTERFAQIQKEFDRYLRSFSEEERERFFSMRQEISWNAELQLTHSLRARMFRT